MSFKPYTKKIKKKKRAKWAIFLFRVAISIS